MDWEDWFPAYAGMTSRGGCVGLLLPRVVDSRLRGNDGFSDHAVPACALVAQKNFVLHYSRPGERADQVRNDGPGDVGIVLFTRVTLPHCGYCLEASMTATLHRPPAYALAAQRRKRLIVLVGPPTRNELAPRS